MSISPSPAIARSSYVGALSPEYALLGLLWQSTGSTHGYELHRRLVSELGQVWHISLSQTYNILSRLESQGLIAGKLQRQPKRPSRKAFHLTAAGQRRFEKWLRAPTGSSVHAIRVEFTTRLYFALASDAPLARDLIDSQTAEVQRGLQRLQVTLASIPPEQTFNRLGLTLRIRQLTSVLAWLAECRTALGLEK